MQKLMKDSAISKRYASSKENPLRKLSMEELPHKESMGIRFRKDKKQLNLRAAPFNRWLEKQIGRPWDKVHHEVCEASSANPELGLRGQLDWAVEQHVSEIGPDGTAYTYRYAWGDRLSVVHGMYVHPKTKLLSCQPYTSYHHKPHSDPDLRLITETVFLPTKIDERQGVVTLRGVVYAAGRSQDYPVYFHPAQVLVRRIALRRIKSIWYEVDEYEVTSSHNIWGLGKKKTLQPWYDRKFTRILDKRQLGKKELKKFKL